MFHFLKSKSQTPLFSSRDFTRLQLVLSCWASSAQSKVWYFQAPDILFAAIKSLSSCRALGCPGYISHLPALQGRWQKLHRNTIFAASARCRRPLQFHFKCTFLHKELGEWVNRYLSLRFAAEIVSYLDVFEHSLQKWPLFLGSKIWKTILGNYPDLCIS